MPTIIDKFKETVEQHGDKTALAFLQDNNYQIINYQQLNNYRLQLAHHWQKQGWQAGEKVAVMLPNSPEWVLSDLTVATLGLIIVPIHTTYNQEYLAKIIKHSDSSYLIIHQEYFDKYKETINNLALKKIIIVGDLAGQANQNLESWPKLSAQEDLKEIGNNINSNGVHTIVYTSGTTGDPKGVMLSHQNLVSNVESAKRAVAIDQSDRFFSFLPLSHAFERTAGYYAAIFSGSSLYFAGSVKTLVDDIKQAKPTILPSVPRIFERIYDQIFDKIRSSSPLKQKLFYQALNLAKAKRNSSLDFLQKLKFNLLDYLVLKKIRASLGGKLRMAISGAASLNPAIAKFFDNIGIKIIEGYGLTETSPIMTVNRWENYKFSTVGLPIDCNEIKIADNKEILVRGDNIMLGYYNNPTATEEIIDQDKWLHTGDLGFIDNEGFLTIIGRAKDMIILSNGKNIFPEPIEYLLNANQYISQSMVYGAKDKVLKALIVPDFNELKIWCEERSLVYELPQILASDRILEFYQEIINKSLNKLPDFEQIKSFKLVEQEFTQENNFLTPSLKLRRGKILDSYS